LPKTFTPKFNSKGLRQHFKPKLNKLIRNNLFFYVSSLILSKGYNKFLETAVLMRSYKNAKINVGILAMVKIVFQDLYEQLQIKLTW
jgi:hypothetical protein